MADKWTHTPVILPVVPYFTIPVVFDGRIGGGGEPTVLLRAVLLRAVLLGVYDKALPVDEPCPVCGEYGCKGPREDTLCPGGER